MDMYHYYRYFPEFNLSPSERKIILSNFKCFLILCKSLSQVQENIGSNIIYPYVRIYFIEKYLYEMEPIHSFSSIFANPDSNRFGKYFCE